jgi:DNA-binding YbaB/EbfC family protein
MAEIQHLWPLGQTPQARLHDLQSELWSKTFDGTAGGGLVRATADGRGIIRNVDIDAMAFEGRDAELLADLVLAAVSDAQRRALETVQAEMRKLPALASDNGQ